MADIATDLNALAVISKAEIDQQVATARAFPRSLEAFSKDMKAMVTMSEEVAAECIFALPRGKNDDGSKKFVEGPSVRFSEIALYNFGNARSGARPLTEEHGFVTCEGFFHDLEKNVAIRVEIRRSILTSKGQRFSADMITMATNAACSLARRNATLQGIPKALWTGFYDLARTAAIGDEKTLSTKRTAMMAYFQKMSIAPETILEFLSAASVDAITLDDLAVLKGIATAIKEGAVTPDKAFVVDTETGSGRGGKAGAAIDKINEQKSNHPGVRDKVIVPVTPDSLQILYRMLNDLSKHSGESPDDILSKATEGKYQMQQDLEGINQEQFTTIRKALDAELAKTA